jgi:hypothetical protein
MEIYFRASEDSQLRLPGLGFEPSSSLKSSPIVAESWPSDGPISPTSETFDRPQTLSLFADESQFYQQESPASQLVLPGSEKAQQMTVGSGRQLSMLLSESDPLGVFSRTLLASSAWTNSEEYCYVWQILDTPFGLSAFQLTQLGQSTEETGVSLWRTPTASDAITGSLDGERLLAAGRSLHLVGQVITPTLWPIPCARDWKSENLKASLARHDPRPETLCKSMYGCRQTPEFTEALMGYPIGHTALEHSATPSCRRKRSRSSKRSIKSKQH